MALQVVKGVFAVTTSAGADITISGLTDPKAILLWSTRQTAEGQATVGQFYFGWFTFDEGAVRQGYLSGIDNDAVGTSECGFGTNANACLKGYSAAVAAGAPTVDFELRGVSMDATSIVIDTFDAPAATVDVHYLVFGGSDLTRAHCNEFAATTTGTPPVAQDVVVPVGSGKPDLVLLFGSSATSNGEANGTPEWIIGAGKDAAARNTDLRIADAATAMDVSQLQKANVYSDLGAGVISAEATIAARADWPADGFRMTWNDLGGAAIIFYLALYGTFQSAIGATTVPIAGVTPVAQNINAGFPPVGALLWGGTSTATTAIVTADQAADTDGLGGMFLGGTDGTNEGYAGLTQNDAHTTSTARRQWSESKAYAIYTPTNGGNSTLRNEADGPFSGNNLALSWTTIQVAGPAREFNYLILGSAAVVERVPYRNRYAQLLAH